MMSIKARKVRPIFFLTLVFSLFLVLPQVVAAQDIPLSTTESSAMVETAVEKDQSLQRSTALPSASPRNVPDSVAPSAPPINPGANLASLVVGLLFILALIFALAWLVRRMGQGGFMNSPHIHLVAAMPLGTRERLAVVDVGGQQILLGITATQINTLHVFAEPVVPLGEVNNSDFGKKLLAALQPRKSSPQGSIPPIHQEPPQ